MNGKIYYVIALSENVKRKSLTNLEKKVMWALTKYSDMENKNIISEIGIKPSTFYSIKRRIIRQGLIRELYAPMINKIGGELLVVIHSNFNPVIPLSERVKATKRAIEISEEIFLSVGEEDKGFSLSFSKDYTSVGRINDIRTETFGKLGLLDGSYPLEIIFPFEISRIERFFDYSKILSTFFEIEDEGGEKVWFSGREVVNLNENEKKVLVGLLDNPGISSTRLSEKISIPRGTIERIRRELVDNGLIRRLFVPDLKKLGFEILAFYHIRYNPNKPPTLRDLDFLKANSSLFFASRKFESVIISAHPNYQSYKNDKMRRIRYLRENNLVAEGPLIRKYMLEKMKIIKDLDFVSITRKILGI